MLGKLTWAAIPFDQPIPLVAGAVVLVLLLAVLVWIVVAGHLPYLWREWITSVDHKRIGVMYCLYHYVDYPEVDREARIIMARIAGAGASLSLQIARLVESIRKEELRKVPGVAETLDWAAALVGLNVRDLHDSPEIVHETLMCKTHEDRSRVTREVTERLLGKVA
jgi:hypothetical protein